jgi:predicted RNA-binding Zn ribbon-like protein
MDRNIEDVMEHFCYLPKQSPANAQDIPFFLSTRLETPAMEESAATEAAAERERNEAKDPTQLLAQYENRAAQLAAEYEENMVRF